MEGHIQAHPPVTAPTHCQVRAGGHPRLPVAHSLGKRSRVNPPAPSLAHSLVWSLSSGCAWLIPKGGRREIGGWHATGSGRQGRHLTLALWNYMRLLRLPVSRVTCPVAPLAGTAAVTCWRTRAMRMGCLPQLPALAACQPIASLPPAQEVPGTARGELMRRQPTNWLCCLRYPRLPTGKTSEGATLPSPGRKRASCHYNWACLDSPALAGPNTKASFANC